MVLIPVFTPNETISIEPAPGGKVELRIGRAASRSAVLTAAEARRVAEALMQEGTSRDG